MNHKPLALRSSNGITKNRQFKGFTLIELLVVISIIGILAAFIVASFTSAQQKARDSRRKADLDAFRKAMEMAKNDSQASSFYPDCVSYTVDYLCPMQNADPYGSITTLNPTYIKIVPSDPKNVVYILEPGATAPASGTTNCGAGPPATQCTTYLIRACLENENDNTPTAAGSNPGKVASYAPYTAANCPSGWEYIVANN